MALGDVKSTVVSVAATGVLNIQPVPGEEWAIHNLYYSGAVDFYRTDGTISIKFDQDSGGGARLGYLFRCTNTSWIQLRNPDAGIAIDAAYDGIQTK